MEYSAEEDAMILDMVRSCRQPKWKQLVEQMKAKGFNRTENGLICRYRVLPKPYEFKAVHKLMQAVICSVRRKANTRVRGSKWQKANRKRCNENSKRSRDLHKDEDDYKAAKRAREKRHRPAASAREKARLRDNVQFYVTKTLRNRMADFIVRCRGTKKAAQTMKLVGCSPAELVNRLQRLSALQSGVSIHDGQIDHIFPFAAYNMQSEEHQRAVCHFTNVQLLTAEENLEKGSRLPTKAMAERTFQCNWPPGIKYDDLPDIYEGWRSPLYK